MTEKTVLRELKRLKKTEHQFYKDKETQMVDYQKKAVTIVGGSEDNEFLMGLLYELYSGQLYGDRNLVRVYLLDSKSNLEKAEFAYVSIWTSDFILTSNPKRALKKSEYVIINPNIKWDHDVTRDKIIGDMFPFLKTLSEQILEFCIPSVQILLVGSRCMVPFRLILALFLNKLPFSQVHGVTRIVERAAASLISHKAECNSNEVQGIAVFGEDIVEVENAWLQWSPACDADLIDLTTVKYGDPELGQWVEKRNELKEAMARLELPKGVEVIGVHPLSPNLDDGVDLPPLEVPKVDLGALFASTQFGDEFLSRIEDEEGREEEIVVETKSQQGEEQRSVSEETEDKTFNEVTPEQSYHKETDQKSETSMDWHEWMKERFPEFEEKPEDQKRGVHSEEFYKLWSTAATRFRESSKPWQCPIDPKPLEVPKENVKDEPVPKLCSNLTQRVTTIIKDERFLKGTITEKCRSWLHGYAQAKGVINYIRKVLLSKKSVYTNEVVCSPGIYGIPEGIYSSFPVRIDPNRNCKIIQGYDLSDITLLRIRSMVKEVMNDYELVFELFYYNPPPEIKEMRQVREEHEQMPEEEPMEAIPEQHVELKEEMEEELQE